MNKNTQIKQKQVRKLSPDDLQKVTGAMPTKERDCTGPSQPTCIAYLVVKP